MTTYFSAVGIIFVTVAEGDGILSSAGDWLQGYSRYYQPERVWNTCSLKRNLLVPCLTISISASALIFGPRCWCCTLQVFQKTREAFFNTVVRVATCTAVRPMLLKLKPDPHKEMITVARLYNIVHSIIVNPLPCLEYAGTVVGPD